MRTSLLFIVRKLTYLRTLLTWTLGLLRPNCY